MKCNIKQNMLNAITYLVAFGGLQHRCGALRISGVSLFVIDPSAAVASGRVGLHLCEDRNFKCPCAMCA